MIKMNLYHQIKLSVDNLMSNYVLNEIMKKIMKIVEHFRCHAEF